MTACKRANFWAARAAISLAALLLAAGSDSATLVKDIRISSGPDGTRVVLDLSEPAKQKLFTLDRPDRIVLDISDAKLDLTKGWPAAVGIVKHTRAAKRDNGDLRLVFDIANTMQARAFQVAAMGEAGPRLVLDLFPPGSAAPRVASRAVTETTTAAVAPAPAPVEAAKPIVKPEEPAHEAGRDLIIAIDAGHGGEDPGAIGRRGAQEKNVTLAIARRLKEKIDAEAGMRAVLTRDGDYFVPLRDRINRARQLRADLFISIHADSVGDHSVTGSSVYVLSSRGASNEAARYLAERENAADLLGGVSLDDKNDMLASVLLDVYQGATMSASADAASKVLKALDGVGDVHHSVVQQAGFVVLKSPDIPSMLVETAFISNVAEESKLTDARHQERLANAILSGVRTYFYLNAPPGTRLAQLKTLRQANAVGRSELTTSN